MANKKDLLLLFEHPQEPVFIRKGSENVIFDMPEDYYIEKYRELAREILHRDFPEDPERHVPVKYVTPPDLKIPLQLGRQDYFSLFIPLHRTIAGHLIDIFMGPKSIVDLQSIAVYARDRLNPYLFNYALSVAILNRPDTKDLNIPSLFLFFPSNYVDSKIFAAAREEIAIVEEGSRQPIIIPRDYTASDLEEEHRLWYFREDMGINLHHWHWHLVYPFTASDRAIVDKDRRGELFYYMHQQIIARYNFERFSNHLPRVKRLSDLRSPIPESYFPKMDSLIASRAWPARPGNSALKDLNRELDQIKVDVADLERWRDRFYETISQGFILDDQGNQIKLDETKGIDILGNMMEASDLSPNRQLYGDLHNFGHVFLSYVHDPDHRHLESFGVIGDSTTAMRDPVFYRWHAYVDDIFQTYKETLPAYTLQQLSHESVNITAVTVTSEQGAADTLQTFWQESDINFSKGLDFLPRGDVFARITHLQHIPFTYNFTINNAAGTDIMGTVRIFLAPKFDEKGTEMLFRDQRLLMTEMDKFTVKLHSGENTVRRRSMESSVTIPFERTFRNLNERPTDGTAEGDAFNICGCGWPEHMLVPKGLPEGLRCELFVMVSKYEDDMVDQDLSVPCADATSFCGIRDRLYPDKRAMGYPFDRLPTAGVDRLSNFLQQNMFLKDINIVHTDRTEMRKN